MTPRQAIIYEALNARMCPRRVAGFPPKFTLFTTDAGPAASIESESDDQGATQA